MATLFPILQFFDNTTPKPLPLSGGLIYTYAAGSSTPKTAYKQQGESSNHTNPIVLDSNGRPPSNGIWLNGAYKIVIKSSDGATTYHTLDNLNEYNPVDWTGLTASISDLNTASTALGAAGTVTASKGVVVDSSKNISTFGNLTATNLIANTSIQTPLIKDSNGLSALTIASVASQVNGITVTPSITGAGPTLAASGTDSNLALNLNGKGTGKVILNGFSYPTADGTNNQALVTNGSKVLSFATLTGVKQVVSQVVNALANSTTVIPYDNTIPQNTEGVQVLTASITPTTATSTLLIFVDVTAGSNSTSRLGCAALFQDATASALAAAADSNSIHFVHVMTSGTTSSTTFNVRAGPSAAGSLYVNGDTSGNALFGGVCNTSLVIIEIV